MNKLLRNVVLGIAALCLLSGYRVYDLDKRGYFDQDETGVEVAVSLLDTFALGVFTASYGLLIAFMGIILLEFTENITKKWRSG